MAASVKSGKSGFKGFRKDWRKGEVVNDSHKQRRENRQRRLEQFRAEMQQRAAFMSGPSETSSPIESAITESEQQGSQGT